MVNYCCVRGCGRNSLNASNLHFHAAPRDLRRHKLWFKLANRLDILEKPVEFRVRYRFCSRHFDYPSVKNRQLRSNAVPSLHLPGSENTDLHEEENRVKTHEGVSCNNCSKIIIGFRYKCLVCENYDICSQCECKEFHSEHFMLRIPTPIKLAKLKTIISKWHQYHKQMEATDYSSDDEPITKYKSYDSGVELSEDVKESIRNSIDNVFDSKILTSQKKKKIKGKKRASETDKLSKGHMDRIEDFVPMAFADVNEIPNMGSVQPIEVKTEEPFEPFSMPLMSMKLSDDLNSMVVDVNSQKMEYS